MFMQNFVAKYTPYLIGILSTFIFSFYMVMILPFEIPDEQSHYAQTHFYLTTGRMPTLMDESNLSVEEELVERVFGVMSMGENKYSRHPEYRLQYVGGYTGKYEEQIGSYNTRENRTNFTIYQSSTYPPLYYWWSSLFYKTVSSLNLIARVYTMRIASLLISIFVPVVAFYFGLRVWSDKFKAFVLSLMTLFFPMTTYLGVGINSDNLHNLLFAIFLLLCVDLIKHESSKIRSLQIGTVIGLDLLTKPQAYILIPTFILALIICIMSGQRKNWLKHMSFIIAPILLIAGWQEIPKLLIGNSNIGVTSYVARSINYGTMSDFRTFLTGYITTHLKEMVVWYWGVFKWFGVLLPKPLWWLANRLVLLSGIGLIIMVLKEVKNKKISYLSKIVIFSISANLIYIVSLFWFDWQFYQEYGRSLGLQARYYMPLLIPQLFLLYQGLMSLSWNNKVKRIITHSIVFFFTLLQLGSLFAQISSYYDIFPIHLLIEEMSQYKPWIAKGSAWYIWIALYIVGLSGMIYSSISLLTISKLKKK